MNVSFVVKGKEVAGTGITPTPEVMNKAPQPALEKKDKPRATMEKVPRKEANPQPAKFQQRQAVDHSTKDSADSVVTNVIQLYKNGGIPAMVCASIITGRIRSMFINGIRKDKDQILEYEVESFKYLDNIFFNDLTYLIMSTITFGSQNSVPLNNITRMITDTAKVIDYFIPQEDMERMRRTIIEVYHAF